MRARPVLLVLGALVALAALVGVGAATTPAAPRSAAATLAPVEGVTLVCPDLRNTPQEQLASLPAAAVGGAPTATDAGSTVSVQRLGDEVGTPVPLSAAGQAVESLTPLQGGVPSGDSALVVSARGALAAGLQAEQYTRALAGSRRGLAGLACSAPQADTWFAGGSLGPGESVSLVLANPEDTAAVVDIQVWAAEGPVDPRLGRGIVVPARSRTTVGVDTLAPGLTGLALHVAATRGRVTAALEHVRGPGLGADWVPPSPPPASRVVLPALPAGPGTRTVLVTNPGPAPTVVQVQVTTGDRQFVPTGLDALAVPAGTTVSADLTGLLATTPAAVAVTSQAGPVLAVGRAVDGAGPVQDLAYAGAAGPLTGPAVLPWAQGAQSVLLLSALAGDASVVVTPLPFAGIDAAPPPARTVAVPGGTTVALPLADLGPFAAVGIALQLQPAAGSGPVRAVAYLHEDLPDGPLSTLLALSSPARTVERPAVVADPGLP